MEREHGGVSEAGGADAFTDYEKIFPIIPLRFGRIKTRQQPAKKEQSFCRTPDLLWQRRTIEVHQNTQSWEGGALFSGLLGKVLAKA